MTCFVRIAFLIKYNFINTKSNNILSCLQTKLNIIPKLHCRSLVGTVKHDNENKSLYSTDIILQDGISFLEMPCIVQLINGDFEPRSNISGRMGEECSHINEKLLHKKDFQKELRCILEFMKCRNLREVIQCLNEISKENITGPVAVAIIHRMVEFENGDNIENKELSQEVTSLKSHLIKIICSNLEPPLLLDCLRSMARDPQKNEKPHYLEKLCTEALILATESRLTIDQVCELIKAFSNLGEWGREFSDKAWVGINESAQIDVNDICKIVKILSLVRYSRIYLYNIVERKVPLLTHQLKSEHIFEILHCLVKLNLPFKHLPSIISRWISHHTHELTPANINWIIASFTTLEYTDKNIQHFISQLLTPKSNKINNCILTQILEYCHKLRIRHPTILSFVEEYFVQHGKSLSPTEIFTLVRCFGYLNYHPRESYNFFSILESEMEDKFGQFLPSELIELCLSCTYLERHPLNFVQRLFKPHFLNRQQQFSHIRNDRKDKENLLILNTVLSFEALNYEGAILLKRLAAKIIERDARIMRCMNRIKPILTEIIGVEDAIHHSVMSPILPACSLFVIDFVVDKISKLNLKKFKFGRERMAILILLPEHYDITENILIGPQVMKKRILQHIGFRVIHLNYRKLNKLYVYPKKLSLYIKEAIRKK